MIDINDWDGPPNNGMPVGEAIDQFIGEDNLETKLPDFLDQTFLNNQTNSIFEDALDFKPFDHQLWIHEAILSARYVVGAASRRSGKTYCFVHELVDQALRCYYDKDVGWITPRYTPTPDRKRPKKQPPRYLYAALTEKQASSIVWPILKNIAKAIKATARKSEYVVELKNGVLIEVTGIKNADALRGKYLDGLVADEYAYWSPSVWEKDLSPQTIDYDGFAWFISTPKGRNHFYKMFMESQLPEKTNWACFHLPASKINHFDQVKLEGYKKSISKFSYEQEMECDFDAPIQGSYYGEVISPKHNAGQLGAHPPVIGADTFVGVDLGVNDAMCLWWGQIHNMNVRFFDCYNKSNMSLAHLIDKLREKRNIYDLKYAFIFVPHDVKNREQTYSDKEGFAKSRLQYLMENGSDILTPGQWAVVPQHKVQDRIQSTRSVLKTCLFNTNKPSVQEGLNNLSLYQRTWDDQTQQYAKTPKHDSTSNYADAFGYACHMLMTHKRRLNQQRGGGGTPPSPNTIDNFVGQMVNTSLTKQLLDSMNTKPKKKFIPHGGIS